MDICSLVNGMMSSQIKVSTSSRMQRICFYFSYIGVHALDVQDSRFISWQSKLLA